MVRSSGVMFVRIPTISQFTGPASPRYPLLSSRPAAAQPAATTATPKRLVTMCASPREWCRRRVRLTIVALPLPDHQLEALGLSIDGHPEVAQQIAAEDAVHGAGVPQELVHPHVQILDHEI